jgi:hypothetical protein
VQTLFVAAQSGDLTLLERVLSADADQRENCGPRSMAASSPV